MHGRFFENFIKSWKINLVTQKHGKNSSSSNQGNEQRAPIAWAEAAQRDPIKIN